MALISGCVVVAVAWVSAVGSASRGCGTLSPGVWCDVAAVACWSVWPAVFSQFLSEWGASPGGVVGRCIPLPWALRCRHGGLLLRRGRWLDPASVCVTGLREKTEKGGGQVGKWEKFDDWYKLLWLFAILRFWPVLWLCTMSTMSSVPK